MQRAVCRAGGTRGTGCQHAAVGWQGVLLLLPVFIVLSSFLLDLRIKGKNEVLCAVTSLRLSERLFAVRESSESAERNISRSKSGTICCRSWLSVRVMKGEIIAGPPMSVTRSVEIGLVTLHRLILPSRRQHLLWVSCETPAELGIRAFFVELSLRLILTKFDNFLTSTHKTLINEGWAEQRDRGGSHSALTR